MNFVAAMLAAVNFNPIIQPILEVLNAILWPAIAIVGSAGTLYGLLSEIKTKYKTLKFKWMQKR